MSGFCEKTLEAVSNIVSLETVITIWLNLDLLLCYKSIYNYYADDK